MRKKYNYFINGKDFTKQEFVNELKLCCRKIVSTDVVAGWCGVEYCEFDENKFNKYMRDIEKGSIIVFYDSNKVFRRKEIIE